MVVSNNGQPLRGPGEEAEVSPKSQDGMLNLQVGAFLSSLESAGLMSWK
jgi:hypothetical protein